MISTIIINLFHPRTARTYPFHPSYQHATFPPFPHHTQDGDEKVRLQASEERGTAQYFGERALLNNEPRAATVKVVSKDAKALVSRSAFSRG